MTRTLRFLIGAVTVVVLSASAALYGQAQPPSTPAFNLKDAVPFDTAIHKGTLPNGLTYYVRQNKHPEKRVSMRLAVKAGALNEADDQQGLAHLIQHIAVNGSNHLKSRPEVSSFQPVGGSLRPHRNRDN